MKLPPSVRTWLQKLDANQRVEAASEILADATDADPEVIRMFFDALPSSLHDQMVGEAALQEDRD